MRFPRSTINVPEHLHWNMYIYDMFRRFTRTIIHYAKKIFSGITITPAFLFLEAAALWVVLTLLLTTEPIDIYLNYDDEPVVPKTFFLWVGAISFTVVILLYWRLHRWTSQKMFVRIHVLLTAFTLLAAIIVFFGAGYIWPPNNFQGQPDYPQILLNEYRNRMLTYGFITFLLIAEQMVFVFHLLNDVITRIRKKQLTLS